MGAYPRVCRRWLHSPGYAQLCLPGVDVVGFVASPTASAKCADWDRVGMRSRGVAGAENKRPQRGERCIARRAIAARGEASPRASKKREMGKGLK